MKSFKEFGIKQLQTTAFTGVKIKMSKVLNQEIIINNYRIEDSNYGGKRLDMDIIINDEKRLLWTSAKPLIAAIQSVPEMPFKATIIHENDTYYFN